MRDRIIDKTGILARPRTILFDQDQLWSRFVGDEAAARPLTMFIISPTKWNCVGAMSMPIQPRRPYGS